jgi:hypothetical protein
MSPLLCARRPAGDARLSWPTRSFASLLAAAGAALSLLAIPASASALEHPFIENLGQTSGAEPTFTEAEGMAVEPDSGDLLVIDAGLRNLGEATISRWHPDGTPAPFSALGSNVIDGHEGGPDETPEKGLRFTFPEEAQVAVDDSGGPTDGNIYVAQVAEDLVDVFAASGAYLGQLTEYDQGPDAYGSPLRFSEPCGVAVDPAGNVFVGDYGPGIHKYEPTSNPPQNTDSSANFSFAQNCYLAAGTGPSADFLFPVRFNRRLSKLDAFSGQEKYALAEVPEPVNADDPRVTVVSIDPASGTVFAGVGNEVREYDASGETEAIPLTPIAPGGEQVNGIAVDGSTSRIYVSRKGNPHIEVWGPAAQLPTAATEEASIGEGTITLHGTVSANEGPPATCVFQYANVKTAGFKAATSLPCDPAGPFTGTATETVSAQLTDLPEAWYRFRLLVSNQGGSTAGETFFFSTIAEPDLPDERAYEMVSPPQKAGEVIPPEPSTQLGGSCGDCLPGENFVVAPMQSTADGDSVLYLGQPFGEGLAAGANEYLAPRGTSGWGTRPLSTPATVGVYQAFSDDLSRAVLRQGQPTLSPQAPSRGGEGFENLYLLDGSAAEPLMTSEPPNRDPGDFKVQFDGANTGTATVSAFTHVAFEADDALTEAVPGVAPAAPEVADGKCTFKEAECNLYEWVDGGLRLVNVAPDESAARSSVIGSGRLLVSGDPNQATNIDHAISDDGRRIFWSSEETGQVYVRVDGEETLEIPGPGSCKETIPKAGRACFLTASPDGSTVLLSDGTLYELNGAGTAYEQGADLTEEEGGFQGILGEDLSRIYFVDTAVLSNEGNANEEEAEAGKLNLYSWDAGGISFIGKLASGDKAFGTRGYGTWAASPSQRTAQISRDGTWLAFMSLASLTGFDSTLPGGGKNCPSGVCFEVFVYSASSGELICASCNPSGQRVVGGSNLTLIRPDSSFRQPQNLSPDGSGHVFFESRDTLTTRDLNGAIQDVYEWEPQGVGSCNLPEGCVHLISSGQSPVDSMFMDSSADGSDAFFITRDQLLPTDKDEMLDLYDARVGGGFTEAEESPCLAEACKGPFSEQPPRPLLATPEHFGPGNPAPKTKCRKGLVRRKGRCVRRPKKHEHGDRQDRRQAASRLDGGRRGPRR